MGGWRLETRFLYLNFQLLTSKTTSLAGSLLTFHFSLLRVGNLPNCLWQYIINAASFQRRHLHTTVPLWLTYKLTLGLFLPVNGSNRAPVLREKSSFSFHGASSGRHFDFRYRRHLTAYQVSLSEQSLYEIYSFPSSPFCYYIIIFTLLQFCQAFAASFQKCILQPLHHLLLL